MVVPYKHSPDSKKVQVAKMFDKIAPRYDLLNHLLSLNIDKSWRRKAIKILKQHNPQKVIDIATGTGDLAILASRYIKAGITGVDISSGMLEMADAKVRKLKLDNQIRFLQADSEELPFSNANFDAAMAAFGVRNFENLRKGISEIFRVLMKNGIVVILEFSKPEKAPFRQLYYFYFRNILPFIGKVISGDFSAYKYLPESVTAFPQGAEMVNILEDCGFRNCYFRKLTFGIATIYVGEKTEDS